jgi:hypothetical protein
MTEIQAVIDYEHVLGHVSAGVVLHDGVVIEAAPIVSFMKRQHWTLARVLAHCRKNGWKLSVVNEL